ncbi:MAG TPA: hypothetical protein VGJ57_11740, partial [Nitrospirales bacterium]
MKIEYLQRDLLMGTGVLLAVLTLAADAYGAAVQPACCEGTALGVKRAEGERPQEDPIGIYFLS